MYFLGWHILMLQHVPLRANYPHIRNQTKRNACKYVSHLFSIVVSYLLSRSLTTEKAAAPGDGSVQGDPHFKTWRGQKYDFHGECDLILLQNKDFETGLDLDVHIRTQMLRDMSYISSAVLRIGSDVLEVESQGVYYLNGVANAELPSEFSG
jgi:hypothetical protein